MRGKEGVVGREEVARHRLRETWGSLQGRVGLRAWDVRRVQAPRSIVINPGFAEKQTFWASLFSVVLYKLRFTTCTRAFGKTTLVTVFRLCIRLGGELSGPTSDRLLSLASRDQISRSR
jgi:hypothetical protein